MYSGFSQLQAICPLTELHVIINQWWHFGRLLVFVCPYARRTEKGALQALWQGELLVPVAERPEKSVDWFIQALRSESEFEARKFWGAGEVQHSCMLDINTTPSRLTLGIMKIEGNAKVFSHLDIEVWFQPEHEDEADVLMVSGVALGIPWTLSSGPPTNPGIPREIRLRQ